MDAGDLPVGLVGAGPGRAGRDVVGVVADPVVVVVLAQLGPERLELVLGQPGARGGDRLVQEDRGDGAAEAVARPARDVLVLAVGRLPLPRRGAEELVVLEQRARGSGRRDLAAVLLVGPGRSGRRRGWGTRSRRRRAAAGVSSRPLGPARTMSCPGGCSRPARRPAGRRRARSTSCRPGRCRRPRARGSQSALVGQ